MSDNINDLDNPLEDQLRENENISLNAFLAALAVSIIIFVVQVLVFLCLRNKLARIFKPKTYLVPERERADPPPRNPVGLFKTLWLIGDRDILRRNGLDAYFFLRYLRTMLLIFVPITCVLLPILLPLNYSGGVLQGLVDSNPDSPGNPGGLNVLAWGNVAAENHNRHWAHLILAIGVIIWVCCVFFFEFKIYVKVRQDYLTSAEHRLRASATTVLVNNVPAKWLSDEALRGLFDVLPGGVRNIWLNRDLSNLLEKTRLRQQIHQQLESAETELIRKAKKNQLKQREKDEKAARKTSKSQAPTKKELEQRRQKEDADAQNMARAGQGVSSGVNEDVPHDLAEAVDEIEQEMEEKRNSQLQAGGSQDGKDHNKRGFGFAAIGGGFTKVGTGLRSGVGRAGNGFKKVGHGVEGGVGTTNGFTRIGSSGTDEPVSSANPAFSAEPAFSAPSRSSADHLQAHSLRDDEGSHDMAHSASSSSQTAPQGETQSLDARDASVDDPSAASQNSAVAKHDVAAAGNATRQVSDLNRLFDNEERKWYQFWRPPPGGFASPVPQGYRGRETPDEQDDVPDKTIGQKLLSLIGLGGDDLAPLEYEQATYTGQPYGEDDAGEADAAWRKYVKPKDRPKHRLPRWGFPNFLGWLTFGKKVDTIYWCRTELARLNVEIRTEQANPERYPLLNSAFIQFNEQVSAHMACQSLVHHLPKKMAPRTNEVGPRDVIWSNMAMKWWDELARTTAVTILICTMVVFWAIPVAWTAALANIDGLVEDVSWLHWIRDNDTIYELAGAIAGVLPPAVLALLLVIVPLILDLLADFKGAKTGSEKTEFVQKFFFVFLFVQVFLVVTVASFFASSVDQLFSQLSELQDIQEITNILAENLPRAANYFFSYMILQAMSASSGALMQIGALAAWYILAKILDSTARSKWTRNIRLERIRWGHLFPIYTNFAVIAIIYSVIAPLICIFALITFSLLWVAQRYCLVYVVRGEVDTGGILYPRALNQTFTGLYVMELCMAGLFFILRDENGVMVGTPRAIIMLVTVPLTAIFQVMLNKSFSPLFRYLPITLEDEAAIRDRAFELEQRRRFGMLEESSEYDEEGDDEKAPPTSFDGGAASKEDDEIELRGMQQKRGKKPHFNPVKDVGSLAKRGGKGLRNITWNKLEGAAPVKNAAAYRQQQRQKDLEAQRAIGDALFGGVADDIEDLMPEERNALVMESFKHKALRSRQPTVWIPRDDLGVSDAEVQLTRTYTDNIHISNEGTALDSKVRVVYGRNPPDFAEMDLIDL